MTQKKSDVEGADQPFPVDRHPGLTANSRVKRLMRDGLKTETFNDPAA